MNAKTVPTSHIPFEELSAYVLSSERPDNMLAIAAKVNNHVMTCDKCKDDYYALMALKDEANRAASHETLDESIKTRVFACLYSLERSKSVHAIAQECLEFKKWLSFSIKNLKELTQTESTFFSYPKLLTDVKSHGGDYVEEKTVKSSLCDADKNRVSIGLDGTLSLYFNSDEHPVGKRVIILPDDTEEAPQMFELSRYDSSISCVRFEGVAPGQYTIVVEN